MASGDEVASKHRHTTPAAANHTHRQNMTRKSLAKAGFLLIHNGFRLNKYQAARNGISDCCCQLANADTSGPKDEARL